LKNQLLNWLWAVNQLIKISPNFQVFYKPFLLIMTFSYRQYLFIKLSFFPLLSRNAPLYWHLPSWFFLVMTPNCKVWYPKYLFLLFFAPSEILQVRYFKNFKRMKTFFDHNSLISKGLFYKSKWNLTTELGVTIKMQKNHQNDK